MEGTANSSNADETDAKMTIDYGGNVGIGTTTFSNKLAVSGSMPSAGTPLIQFNETSGSARDGIYLDYTGTTNSAVYSLKIADATKTHLAVRGDGNVGIGTDSPLALLNVNTGASGTTDAIIISRDTYGEAGVIKQSAGAIEIHSQKNLTLGADEDNIFTGTSSNVILKTDGTERVRITSGGLVGVNHSSPVTFLDVRGNSTALPATSGTTVSDGTRFRIGSTTASTLSAVLDFGLGTSSRAWIQSTSVGDLSDTNTLLLNPNGGNVGIGVDSPTARLMVKDSSDSGFDSGIAIIRSANSQTGYINMVGGAMNFNSPSIPITFRQAGAEKMRISGGDVLIGNTTVPANGSGGSAFVDSSVDRKYLKLSSSSDSAVGLVYFDNTNGTVGNISTSGSATTYNTSSDYRLKEDLKDFNALEIASKIKMYDFKWKADDTRSYGVMAHELQEVVPQAVSGNKDAEDMQQVDYSKLVPILLKSIQELEARVKELEKEI